LDHGSYPLCFFFRAFGYRGSDPESEVPFAEALYSDDAFMRAFYDSLSDDGILVVQLGAAPQSYTPDGSRIVLLQRVFLEKLGFESIHAYEDVRYFSFILVFQGLWCTQISLCSSLVIL
jgi:spermidine synthase